MQRRRKEIYTMGNEMAAYIQQLEIIAFFSGYPLVYAMAAAIKTTARSEFSIKHSIFLLLPFAYAVTGILYTGFQLRNLYPDYSYDRIASEFQMPFYTLWACSSVLFFIPLLNRKPFISLLHSLIFFYLLVKKFSIAATADFIDDTVLRNYMSVYMDGILLIAGVLMILLILYISIKFLKRKTHSV